MQCQRTGDCLRLSLHDLTAQYVCTQQGRDLSHRPTVCRWRCRTLPKAFEGGRCRFLLKHFWADAVSIDLQFRPAGPQQRQPATAASAAAVAAASAASAAEETGSGLGPRVPIQQICSSISGCVMGSSAFCPSEAASDDRTVVRPAACCY